jgi:D-threo-aldose 1-dehydrogenase
MTLSDNAEPNEPKIAVEATLASADSRHRSIVGDAAFVTPLPVEDPMSIRDHLLNGPLGFGAAPLGNMYRDVPDEEAAATLEAAWQSGTRYFDTAPFYGAGLAEIRLGNELTRHKRDQYVLSTKVGRIILQEVETGPRQFGEKGALFASGRPNKIIYDYSADGTRRSIEDSLKRIGVDRTDFVWVHDIAQDFHGDGWLAQFEIARTGAFSALTQLRDEGVIKGWGLGVNRIEPVELLLGLSDVKPDGTLLAGRYTLLDHEHALQRLMPAAEAKGVDIVIGGPYSSGVFAGGKHFEYADASPAILVKVEKIKALAERHKVPIKAAALQFSLAHPASAAVIPGATNPERIAEDHAALRAVIPDDFWREMRQQGLVAANAPLPIDRPITVMGMASCSCSIDLPVSAEQVWQLIGGFGSLPDWLPYIAKSELTEGGRVRHLANPDGAAIVERLVAFDQPGRQYTYAILQAPFRVTNYVSTLCVKETGGGNGSRVEWTGRFAPTGVSEEEATTLFRRIYQDGLRALAAKFGVAPVRFNKTSGRSQCIEPAMWRKLS